MAPTRTLISFCRACKLFHPQSDFYKVRNGKCAVICKKCHSARQKRWYRKNKEYVQERNRYNYQSRRGTRAGSSLTGSRPIKYQVMN